MHAIASDGLPVFLILIGKVPGETHPFTSKRTGIAGKDSQLILQYHMEGNIRNLAFANWKLREVQLLHFLQLVKLNSNTMQR